MQTTGGGRWAKISLGTKSALAYQSKVEFFDIDINGQERPFAYGEVRQPNDDYCWVYVDDHKNANVRNNTKVKVSADQSRSFADAFYDMFIYGSKK